MSKASGANPHRTLTILVAANIALDILAIAIWAALPANTWNGMYRLNSLIAGVEAALAAAVFVVVFVGLKRKKKWAPYLAIVTTITQRVFAVYVFFPSYAIPVPLIWSLIIIYFAFKDIQASKAY